MFDFDVNGLDLLGSTGSIGEQAIDVARRTGIRINSICANKNYKRVEEQAREFKPTYCAMFDEAAAAELKTRLSDTDIKVLSGKDGALEMISSSNAEVALNSIIGAAGLEPTLAAIRSKKRLALANKESLVVAGDIVMSAARKENVEIIPVDSEHCAIHQCLRSGDHKTIKKLIITASGGPFFGKSKEELESMTAGDALMHPTWSMGAKITIDSATLMNKGLEIIEASHLFDVDVDRIKPVIHRESIIHSMVEYIDNSIIAQLSVPDMRFCIQYGIFGGARRDAVIDELDLVKIANLSFFEPDTEAFPLLPCAIKCRKMGGGMTAVLNAANEVAVSCFLEGKIRFGEIYGIVAHTVDSLLRFSAARSLDEILEADRTAREFACGLVKNA